MRTLVAVTLIAVLLATGCSGSDDSPGDSSEATCDSSTPIQSTANGPEVQGVGTDASIYGLVFLTHAAPVRAPEDVKIVWRMTGEGDLVVSSTAPSGRPGVLTFGPEPHGSSSYHRPGDEWGTGFTFDEPGCWHIHLQRTTGAGDVWIDVASADGDTVP